PEPGRRQADRPDQRGQGKNGGHRPEPSPGRQDPLLRREGAGRRATQEVTVQATRRAALWGMLAAKLSGGWGVTWNIQWHLLIGRDSCWTPPHLSPYSGVAVVAALALTTLARETWLTLKGPRPPESVRCLGLVGTRGMHWAWWGILITILAAPIDDLWHGLFGLDVTLWSPPHLLGLLGSQVNSAVCSSSPPRRIRQVAGRGARGSSCAARSSSGASTSCWARASSGPTSSAAWPSSTTRSWARSSCR